MIKKILIIVAALFCQISYSQLIDDWILSYSYPTYGDIEFDMSNKRIAQKGILVFEKDSLYTIGFKKSELEIKKVAYKYEPDSLYIGTDYVEQLILDRDTIRNIDKKYKGAYNVYYRLASPKRDYYLEMVKEYLMMGDFRVDLSNILVLQNKVMPPLVDTLTFSSNDKLISKGKNTETWKLIQVRKNIFLEIDNMLYLQVFMINEDSIVFKSYFEVEHDLTLTRIE